MSALIRALFALIFILGGINHFVQPAFYVAIMPPYLPEPLLLVQVSGVAEIILGSALFFPCVRRMAAWGIIALLIAVYPANWNVASHPENFQRFSPAVLWARIPLQLVLIGWAWMYAKGRENSCSRS